jgi:MFS family permease
MKSEKLPFSGWRILAGLMITYAALCGDITYAYGVFLPSMSEAFQWSRSALSGPYVLFFIFGGLLGPIAGHSVARFGARKIMVLFNGLAALGLFGMSFVRELWQVYLCFGVMAGLGIAFAEFIPITTVINNWFIHRRSMAMGFLFSAGGLGGFLLPPLISRLISGFGWRWAWVCLAGLHFLLTVLIGGLLIRGRPEELGQEPDGLNAISVAESDDRKSGRKVYQTPVDWTVEEALRSPALWQITALFAIILFVTNMLTTHQVAYLQDLHFSPFLSATALGLMIGMSILGRLSSGFLGMRYEGRYLAVFFLASMGVGVLFLIGARSHLSIYLYSALTGIGFGGMVVLVPTLLGAYFGRTHYSQIIGWTATGVTLISAGSPSLAGYFYDATGRYQLPFAVGAVLLFAGILIALLTHPPKRKDKEAAAERVLN